MKVLGGILLFLILLAVAVGWFVLAVWVAVWNVTDMQSVGVNFWNMFWLFVAGAMVLTPGGVASSATN